MAKITAESRELFEKKSATYKEIIKNIFTQEREMLALIQKESVGEEYKKLILAEEMIYAVSVYLVINTLSVEILGVKNEEALNEGRKTLYKSIIYLEDIVSNLIDSTSADLEDRLAKIENTPLEKRYYLVRKLGLAINLIIDAYGENTKWKWSFIELQGRFTTVSKNLLNMTIASKDYFDGRAPDHDNTFYYIRMLKKLLVKSSDGYRDRYELSTRRSDDMRLGINYLLAYRRLLIVLGDRDEAEDIKKKAQVWKEKMEADSKKQKQA